ncbi:hypothetical protein CH296_05220 [Rhodococcus sp. 14-2496-1d]|uniref:hypothetical protein n=1 Tax=Rhodococcus sp. 14-2496-1d TaxID=2023146 RepID=UPI000B9C446B|nr:hypothetical protein [Rhodococcus sp. 14-2496-1d]OZF36976.1 hypothetical protein CH296_05220 [Rhodococcus sp. 14-2496-1d]
MTVTPLDKDAIRAAAEAAINDRIAKVEAITEAQQKVVEAEADDAKARAAADAAIKEAQAAKRSSAKSVEKAKDAVAAALRAALNGGWTAQQLRDIGLTVPTSVIAAPKQASTGSGRKKRPLRIGVASAAAESDKPGSGESTEPATPPPTDAAPNTETPSAPQEFASAGQGAQ